MAEHTSNTSRPRPAGDRLADLVVSAEPTLDAPPTPPYRQYPASISDDIQSPPYRSRSQVQLVDGIDEKYRRIELTSEQDMHMVDEKHQPSETSSGKDHGIPDEQRQTKGVHYPEDIPHIEKPVRFDSSTDLASRAPSTVPSEDEHNLDKADDDDYDWSTDEEEVDEEAKKFEQRVGGSKNRSLFIRIVSFFLSTLVGSVLTAGALVGAALAVHFLYYENSSDDNRSHRQYVTQNVEAWLFWAAANLLVSWFLALIIDIVPGVITWIIFIVWGHISESMKSKVEFYKAINDTIKPLFYAASGWLSWVIIFANIFDLYDKDDTSASRASYTPRMFQVIEFFFFFVMVLCVQKVLSQLVAFSFHKTAFKDRLAELDKKLKTIEHLKKYKPRHRSGRSSGLFASFTPTLPSLAPSLRPFGGRSAVHTPAEERMLFSGTGTRVGTPISRKGTPDLYDDGNAGDLEDNSPVSSKKGKGKARIAKLGETPTPVESRPDSPMAGKLFTNTQPEHLYPPAGTSPSPSPRPSRKNSDSDDANAVLQVGKEAGKVLKKAVLHDARNMTGKEDTNIAGLGWAVGSNEEARRLARSIYGAFKTDKRRRYLIVEDFYPAYPNHDGALEAFRVFDEDHNGDISKAEIKSTIVKAYRERRFLSRSMRDVGQAMRSLDRVLLSFAFIIIIFISLSVFGVNFSSSLTSVYTVGIAASFIFKTTCTRIFDSIMFLFVTHPFDTGDRCFIDEENLVVKKMGLLATVFQRADGTETYYFNSQLFTKFITNARRSDKTGELCTLYIAWKTPLAKIDELEQRINSWLAVEENRWFQPQTSVVFQQVANQNYIEIALAIPHNNNWQDWGLRNQVKTTFYAAVNYYCRQLDITYASSPMPLVWAAVEDAQQKPETSPTASSFRENVQVDEEGVAAKNMRPMLGFLPPMERRDAHLLRARKSKYSKNHAMRAVDGG